MRGCWTAVIRKRSDVRSDVLGFEAPVPGRARWAAGTDQVVAERDDGAAAIGVLGKGGRGVAGDDAVHDRETCALMFDAAAAAFESRHLLRRDVRCNRRVEQRDRAAAAVVYAAATTGTARAIAAHRA